LRKRAYLVKRNVVLDVVGLILGFGVIPRDVLDWFAVNSGVVVRSGSEGGCRQVSLSDDGGVGLGQTLSMDTQCCVSER